MEDIAVKALLFDVFGTTVDWRSSVEQELRDLGAKYGIEADWAKFAQQWRTGYMKETARIAAGGDGPNNVDLMHRQVAPHWSEEERDELNLVWHRLRAWPDTVAGLQSLKKKYIIGTLSNGNVRLLIDMAKYADLPWDVIFSGELFQSYKPDPKVYLEAIRYLSLEPHEVAMVAAHAFDLRAAAQLGMRTFYVHRDQEESDPDPGVIKSKKYGGEFDVVTGSFLELAAIISDRED
ncbi:hypothetical protein MD484_g984, partial [Candolleomyces efflorescens]